MKKITSYLPHHISDKTNLIKYLNKFIYENFPSDIANEISIINIKGDIIIISCKNTSLGTMMRFEKEKYIEILKSNSYIKINDFKIVND